MASWPTVNHYDQIPGAKKALRGKHVFLGHGLNCFGHVSGTVYPSGTLWQWSLVASWWPGNKNRQVRSDQSVSTV